MIPALSQVLHKQWNSEGALLGLPTFGLHKLNPATPQENQAHRIRTAIDVTAVASILLAQFSPLGKYVPAGIRSFVGNNSMLLRAAALPLSPGAVALEGGCQAAIHGVKLLRAFTWTQFQSNKLALAALCFTGAAYGIYRSHTWHYFNNVVDDFACWAVGLPSRDKLQTGASEISKLRDTVRTLTSEKEDLERDLQTATDDNAELDSRLSELEPKVKSLGDEKQALASRVKDLEADIEEKNIQLSSRTTHVSQLQEDARKSAEELSRLQTLLATKDQAFLEQEAKLNDQARRVSELRRQIGSSVPTTTFPLDSSLADTSSSSSTRPLTVEEENKLPWPQNLFAKSDREQREREESEKLKREEAKKSLTNPRFLQPPTSDSFTGVHRSSEK